MQMNMLTFVDNLQSILEFVATIMYHLSSTDKTLLDLSFGICSSSIDRGVNFFQAVFLYVPFFNHYLGLPYDMSKIEMHPWRMCFMKGQIRR